MAMVPYRDIDTFIRYLFLIVTISKGRSEFTELIFCLPIQLSLNFFYMLVVQVTLL